MKHFTFNQIVDTTILFIFTLVIAAWNNFITFEEIVAGASYIAIGMKIGYSKYKDDLVNNLRREMTELQNQVKNL